MALEIERKFLVKGDSWREAAGVGIAYAQGYLSRDPHRSVRVRLAGTKAFLTIKGKTVGISRPEYEYEIPANQAWELLEHLCYQPLIEKTRYRVPIEDYVWEIDEFWGLNQGLIMAEVELAHPEQEVHLPPWIGREVSHDERYFNAYLAQHPYSQWTTKSPEA